ncbi:MAG: DegV family protein [Ruminococcus sp.]|jgi:DegV family protein with EDD domain|nr:DegV family protein [Ruminococcus sp.]
MSETKNQKIKIITDSTSDIPKAMAEEWDIDILPLTVIIDGKSYLDGIDYTTEAFYILMDTATDLPKTSQIMADDFIAVYKKYYDEGYTDIIYPAIASIGSGTYQSALRAVEEFYEEVPRAKSQIQIHCIDMQNYSINYGYAVVEAAKKNKKNTSASEIIEYLKDWSACVEVHILPFTLKFIRKSGRLSAAAAFAGELLGLRPIISIIDGVSSVPFKIRGDKKAAATLLDYCEKRMVPKSPYCMLCGDNTESTNEFVKVITERFGYPPEIIQPVGAVIASHSGHNLIAVIIRGEKRR